MKPVKQKGQDYVGLDMRLEAVVDALMYHPLNRKRRQCKHKHEYYLRLFKGLSGITRRKYGSLRDFNLYFTGVSHLDAAWLFPVVDTKERAYKTFYKAVEHCKMYPWLRFSQTTPQYYAWIKKYDKNLWKDVKSMVAERRIELTGGMWVEPDLDMPSGEALVRQRLYGQLFFLREFGFMPTLSSLLDVFGFPYSLPQILVKSGADKFWTTKCASGFPMTQYYWQGLDGSRIFVFQHVYNWYTLQAQDRYKRKARFPDRDHNHAVLNSHMDEADIKNMLSEDPDDYCRILPIFYGLGDGGRGPLEIEILYADALKKMHDGIHTSQHEVLDLIEKNMGDRYLVWNDEMYLQYHRGTKTTQLEVKHYNRRAECWATAAETLLTLCKIMGIDEVSFKKERLFEMWRKILFNQFHDILPGSSIPDVYELAIKEQKDAIRTASIIIEECLLKMDNSSPHDFLLYNPFNWVRSEYLQIENQWIYAKDVNGLSVHKLNLSDAKVNDGALDCVSETKMHFILENNKLRAKILKESGTLVSLYHKELDVDFITAKKTYKSLGSGFRVFHENPKKWKAWNLDQRYPLKKIKVRPKGPACSLKDASGLMKVKAEYEFLNSSAYVEFSLKSKDDMINMDIHTDVKDPRVLVKYFIPLNLKSEDVVSQIPYGHIARKRIKRTHREKAKWEMNMQKWLDISDDAHGFAILNDNTYGFSATHLGVYLTLTRTPIYPGVSPLYGSTRTLPPDQRPKFTDLKPFDYKFALIPHAGDWKSAKIWQRALNFNLPLILARKENLSKADSGILDMHVSFLTTDVSNVVIGSIKPSEWTGSDFDTLMEQDTWEWTEKSCIVRLIEIHGKKTSLILTCSEKMKFEACNEVDLLEMNPQSIDIENPQYLKIEIDPYEIKTLRIQFI